MRARVVTVLVLALVAAVRVAGHEIGTTQVTAVLTDGRYEIEIVTDAAALLEKLHTVADPASAATPANAARPEGLQARLEALDTVFRQRVEVAFDDARVSPAISYTVSPAEDAASPPLASIHLSGAVPDNARLFGWRYSWTFAPYALTTRNGTAGTPTTEWLEGGQYSAPLALAEPSRAAGRLATAWQYLVLGFTHVVPHGLDHMLFVIGLFLLSRRLGNVLWQVSAFTVAHSVTLGLSIYGVIAVPPAIVEPLIAISIVYVAIENLVFTEMKTWRIALVFAFGLLHGMGFAGALHELGLPRTEFVTALVTFNLGIEAGQLAVIAMMCWAVAWRWTDLAAYRRYVVVPGSMLIAGTAVYWTVERVIF